MFRKDFDAVAEAAVKKLTFMSRSPVGYIAASALAGMFVAFGGFVSVTVGGLLTAAGSPWVKIAGAFAFASALSLVLMAGCELFTGNNMVMGMGVLAKRVKIVDAMKLWLVCWLGNYLGAWIASFLYYFTGLVTGPTAAYFAATAVNKLSMTVPQMFIRGVLCNILVCLAVWCGYKLKSEAGKLIMVFWCIFVFMVCGFEHSVANMSILGVAMLDGSARFWDCVRQIGVVTAGNMAGALLFVVFPYFLCSRGEE